MNKYIAAGSLALALMAAPLVAGTALATAQADSQNAAQTVSELQSQGYTVIVNKLGAKALDKCTAANVRPGASHTRSDYPVLANRQAGVLPVVTTTHTIYVDVTC